MTRGAPQPFPRLLSLSLVGLLAACGPLTPDDAAQQLQAAVTSAVSSRRGGARHGVLLVDAPRLGLSRTFVAGPADGATGAPLTSQTPFLAASVGKLFVAAAVTSLAKQGVLGLDDPLERWVAPAAFSGLPVEGGDAALAQVTLRQLLGHRSGLPDAFSGSKARDGAPTIFALMKTSPERAWTRDAVLAYARAHFDPAGAPGAQFFYSDLNYDLLGLVLEAAGQAPWHEVVRRQVLAPLALVHTWYYNLEVAPEGAGELADVFAADVNLVRQPCLTADQAGGGLATTVGDLRDFLRGLEAGTPVSLDELGQDWSSNAIYSGIDYGHGLWRIRPGGVFFTMGGLPELRGVSGMTGSFVYLAAKEDAVVAGTFDQTQWDEEHVSFLLGDILPVLARVPVSP